jgi:hypothetical protein
MIDIGNAENTLVFLAYQWMSVVSLSIQTFPDIPIEHQ